MYLLTTTKQYGVCYARGVRGRFGAVSKLLKASDETVGEFAMPLTNEERVTQSPKPK